MPGQRRFKPIEPLVPERFREARLSRGLTMNDLAEKVGVSRQSISKYELGISEPCEQVMAEMAHQLAFPLEFFHKPLETPENRGTVFFRSMKTNAARAKEIMSVKSVWATNIAKVLSEDIIFPECDLPSIPEELVRYDEYSLDEVEEIALFLRRSWGLGVAPISNMARLLESHGIIIASIKTGFLETDACSAFVEGRPFIFLDTQKECAVRTRFNMAHELGHLILHGNISQADLEERSVLDRVEREANRFAGCFLLPRQSFLLDIRSTSIQSFLPLKKKWKVSIQAMVYRCRELEIFSDSQMIYIQKQISGNRWRKHEPFDDEWPCEEASILRTAIKMLIDRGDYSKEEFLQIFRLSEKDITELCSLPEDYFSGSSQRNAIFVDFTSKKITN